MPLAELWTEADFIVEHTNALLKTHVLLIHSAIADVVGSGGVFKAALARLDDG